MPNVKRSQIYLKDTYDAIYEDKSSDNGKNVKTATEKKR